MRRETERTKETGGCWERDTVTEEAKEAGEEEREKAKV